MTDQITPPRQPTKGLPGAPQRHHKRHPTVDVNRELPPLPREVTHGEEASENKQTQRVLLPSPEIIERSGAGQDQTSPTRSLTSSDESRLVARRYMDSLCPPPLNIPIRTIKESKPTLVNNEHDRASCEVPIMYIHPAAREAAQAQDSVPGSGSSSVYSNSNSGELLPATQYSGEDHQERYEPAPMTPPEQTEQSIPAPRETIVTGQIGQQQPCCACNCKQKVTVTPSEQQYSSVGEQTVTVPHHAQYLPSFYNPPPPNPTDVPDPQFYAYSPQKDVQNNQKLFGEHGVLGRTSEESQIPSDRWRRTSLVRMGQRIRDLVKESKSNGAGDAGYELPPGIVMKPNLPISLDPPLQASLYSQIELMVCAAANKFLLSQLYGRRLLPDLIRKVTNFWKSKNRPQVPEFQFDQNTQREMIMAHINSLNFYGEYGINNLLLKSTLDNWRSVCAEMNVRTFCYPDSVVRKHMHDLHRVLEMLGASSGTLCAFERLQVEVTNIIAQRRAEDPNNTRAHSSDEDYRYYGLRFHEPLN